MGCVDQRQFAAAVQAAVVLWQALAVARKNGRAGPVHARSAKDGDERREFGRLDHAHAPLGPGHVASLLQPVAVLGA